MWSAAQRRICSQVTTTSCAPSIPTYIINARMMPLSLQEAKSTGSPHIFKLSITLDFEHYDAFSDVYATSHLLDLLLIHCTLHVHRHGVSPRSSRSQRDMALTSMNDNSYSSNHVYGHWALDQDQDVLSKGALADFHWSSPGANFVASKSQFLSYFGEKAINVLSSTTTT